MLILLKRSTVLLVQNQIQISRLRCRQLRLLVLPAVRKVRIQHLLLRLHQLFLSPLSSLLLHRPNLRSSRLVILDAPSESHLAYRPGTNLVWKVIKGGSVVVG